MEIDYGLVSNANFAQKGRVVTDHKVHVVYIQLVTSLIVFIPGKYIQSAHAYLYRENFY